MTDRQDRSGSTGAADVDLLSGVARGDVAAMRALYDRHRPILHRFVASRLRDSFAVQDVVHDTMLDVWRNAAQYGGRSSVRSWMMSIARNKIVDLLRKQSRLDLNEPDQTLPSDTPDPSTVMEMLQEAEHLRDCVTRLSPPHESVIRLAFFEDLSYGEIAEIEGLPLGTIKTRVYHAKRLLMHCLSFKSVEKRGQER